MCGFLLYKVLKWELFSGSLGIFSIISFNLISACLLLFLLTTSREHLQQLKVDEEERKKTGEKSKEHCLGYVRNILPMN